LTKINRPKSENLICWLSFDTSVGVCSVLVPGPSWRSIWRLVVPGGLRNRHWTVRF